MAMDHDDDIFSYMASSIFFFMSLLFFTLLLIFTLNYVNSSLILTVKQNCIYNSWLIRFLLFDYTGFAMKSTLYGFKQRLIV